MTVQILHGDCREVLRGLADSSVHCCVTSPPYFGLRDYGHEGQIGLEQTPAEYVEQMVAVFREVRRVLRDDGTLWLNLGDSYAGYHGNKNSAIPTSATNGWTNGTNENERTSTANRNGLKAKDLIGIPWRVAFALQADGWYLRQDIIWNKPNPMPESVRDRCTKAHEYVFLMSKSERYYFDSEAMKEPAHGGAPGNKRPVKGAGEDDPMFRTREGSHKYAERARAALAAGYEMTRNRRSVWTIATKPFKGAHFATMAPELAETCIRAGCPYGGTVIDPFGGAGTTGLVADQLGRSAVLCELNSSYIDIARRRIAADAPLFAGVTA